MELAFYADPPHTFKVWKDSTYAMMAEAVRRGHRIHVFCQQDMALRAQHVSAHAAHIELTGNEEGEWFRENRVQWRELETFDAVIVRKDPPFDVDYLNATYLLELAEAKGARVFNRPAAIRGSNEKLAIARFPDFTVPTLVSASGQLLRAFHEEYGDIILKPLNAMGGTGVFRVGPDGLNLGAILEVLTANGMRAIMAQRYIPEIVDGDKRVLLINGHIVPYALARIPRQGEVRGNLAAGGVGRAQPLTQGDRRIAEALAPLLAEEGHFLVGLDIIGEWLTEINVTSPTCFREITHQTGFNVAGMFMDELEKAV